MKKLILGSLIVASSLFANDVLAVVNGENVTKAQINELLASQNLTYDKLPPQYQRMVLDKVITNALLIQKAENSGVEKTALYKQILAKRKKQIAMEVFLKQKLNSIKITDVEAKQFYDKNKDLMFKKPQEVKARHILVKDEKQAKDLINQLKNVPQSQLETKFIQLAKKYSKGPSGKDGGELGWFGKGKMIPAFEKVAFSLKKGEFSLEPVKTRFGYHIIYIEDKKDGGYIPFDAVKDKIKQQLKLKKLRDYINSIKTDAKIEYK